MAKSNKDWWRVTYDMEGTRRALFGIGRSSLGGLMIDIGAYKPFGKWRCGVFDLPGGENVDQVAVLDTATEWTPVLAPKFHYHPDGYISIHRDGATERQHIRGPRLDELHGHHVLTVVVRKPHTFPATERQPNDLGLGATAPTAVIKFAVYASQVDDLDPGARSISDAAFAVAPENSSTRRVALIYRFPPYAATLDVQDNPPEFTQSEGPSTIFGTAFDRRTMADATVPTKMLVVQPDGSW